ncbi:hypothetical protein Hsw_3874 [Hymenobacter swuensis DY53]|uniref:Uncharacterized protein n=1 Tax=Hymenobacter swuensis DY53 TaxID=1227739 RepID=W8F269_9BACT|nr:hypothetical protein Hsw_3874 [Hymenobacter swuensis DY53]
MWHRITGLSARKESHRVQFPSCRLAAPPLAPAGRGAVLRFGGRAQN